MDLPVSASGTPALSHVNTATGISRAGDSGGPGNFLPREDIRISGNGQDCDAAAYKGKQNAVPHRDR